MRKPKYLSPSAIETFFLKPDQSEYYLKYLADDRPPPFPQTDAMSVGSSFDAYVKAELVSDLGLTLDGFDLDTLFTTQVEEHNRDFALSAGATCMEAYKTSGAYRRLLHQLQHGSEVQFEFTAIGTVLDVPVRGKPDLQYRNEAGAIIIVDWKVNGFCSKSGASPKKGYVLCMDGWHGAPSRSHNSIHKDAHLMRIGGIDINIASFFEDVDERWARQLSTYGWLGGEEIGSNFILQIEQLACNPKGQIRCATHAGRSSKEFQHKVSKQYQTAWKAINEGHIFTDLTYEQNKAMCEKLDHFHKAYHIKDEKDAWFNTMRGK